MRVAALAAGAALGVAACSYDLDLLRGRDGGADVARVDVPVAEMPTIDAAPPPDRVAPDVPVDVRPARDASMGACMSHTPVNLAMGTAGVVTSSGVATVEGNTNGGGATIVECTNPSTTTLANTTRVYRYVVQTGPRLVATTNTGLCTSGAAGYHDTVLAAYFNCAPGGQVSTGRSCNDDDSENLCEGMTTCSSNTNLGCGTTFSTLELSSLVPGDVIYFAVSSLNYMTATAGTFRLSVAENGLSPAAPPVSGGDAGAPAANRCVCPPATTPFPMWASRPIDFPRATDQNQLMSASRSVFSNRAVGLSQVWGLSGSLRLSVFNVATMDPCSVSGGAKAALDITVGAAVVASFSLGAYVGQASTIAIPFTSFSPIPFAAGAATTIQYRIRNVDPAEAACVTVNIDLNAPNTLTLYGAM